VAHGTHAESQLALHLDKMFEQLGIEVVLDVGARIGDYGLWLRHNGFTGRIISFEPVQSSLDVLQSRADRDPKWDVVPVALGAEDGEADINVSQQTFFSSFFEPNDYAFEAFEDGPRVDHVEHVAVRRLDGVLADVLGPRSRPDVYLKMDTQGWDLEVLRGAAAVRGDIAALQSEVSVQPIYDGMPDMEESLATLAELGFTLSGLFPVNLDANLRVVEFDCVCVADR
jgi:FkbM family methyltransferase